MTKSDNRREVAEVSVRFYNSGIKVAKRLQIKIINTLTLKSSATDWLVADRLQCHLQHKAILASWHYFITSVQRVHIMGTIGDPKYSAESRNYYRSSDSWFWISEDKDRNFRCWECMLRARGSQERKRSQAKETVVQLLRHKQSNCTVLPAKSDSHVMFCLHSYQGLTIDRSLVY